MNNLTKALCSVVVTLALAGNSGSGFAAIAGHVQFVYGTAQLTTAAGMTHQIRKGDAVNEGDTLTTAPAASAQVKMEDGGFVAIRPDTLLKFDSFKFNGQQDGTEQSFFSLLKGGFRAVTGLIGRLNKPNYRITTPTASLGIRGTDHETFVVTAGSPLAAKSPVGTYNKVNLGEISMTTGKGTIFILPNQMGFAGAADQMPQLQPLNLNIFTVTPAPQVQGNKNEEGVRDSAVVDSVLQVQDFALGNTLPVSPSLILTPITVTYQPVGTTFVPPPITKQIAP
ncbi:MAG: FecR family protein [Gallionella sp.]